MKRRVYRIILALNSILIVSIIVACSNNNNKPAMPENPLPITALYLNGSVLHFYCSDVPKCFPDVDLGEQTKATIQPDVHPLNIGFAYYGNDSTLYILLEGSAGVYLVKVNPQTGQVLLKDPMPFMGGYSPGMALMVHGKLVLATNDGKISVVQDDFSMKTFDIKAPIWDFIETGDARIAAISTDGFLQDGSRNVKVFLVDINSGAVEEKFLNGPSEEGESFLITIDQDITRLYLEPVGKDSTDTGVLNVFDVKSQKTILSVATSDIIADFYSLHVAKLYQYHGMWYYSRRCCLEGPAPAMLVNMSMLKPVINPGELSKDESDATFLIAPFGDDFLIGMTSHILLVSPDGTVIKTYPLPEEWIGQDYRLLEYRK